MTNSLGFPALCHIDSRAGALKDTGNNSVFSITINRSMVRWFSLTDHEHRHPVKRKFISLL